MNARCWSIWGVGAIVGALGCVHGSEPLDLPGAPDTDAGPVRPWALAMTSEPTQPPLAGGTLLITADGATAVVSDPDHARLVVVDLAARTVRGEIALDAGDDPGRAAQDDAGRVFVAMRRSGDLLTVDVSAARIVERRAVCTQPRGVAYDPDRDRVLVACAEGQLVALPAAGGAISARMTLDDDLRDVAVRGNRIYVSRFRTADVLTLDPNGVLLQRALGSPRRSVAWRMQLSSAGEIVLLHQVTSQAPVPSGPSGYGGSGGAFDGGVCVSAIVEPAITVLSAEMAAGSPMVFRPSSLSVDFALSASGTSATVVIPGHWGKSGVAPWVDAPTSLTRGELCMQRPTGPAGAAYDGQAVAIAARPNGVGAIVQFRAPAMLVFTNDGTRIPLGGGDAADTGHRMFHTNPEGTMTCASCHPEGNDDGRTWNFSEIGPRRTPTLRGGLLGTEPFHWDGDMRDFGHLVDEVLARRMGAPRPSPAQATHLARWVDRLPPLPMPVVPAAADAVARGRALFERADVGCTTCHGGPRHTNNQTVDVGTGGRFQVPPLVNLRWHAPYMHNGCAITLRDRFGACGGGDRHGRTSGLTSAQIGDLVAYLETL